MPDQIYLEQGTSLQSSSGNWYRIVQLLGAGGNAVTHLVQATSGGYKGVLFALKLFRRLSKPERVESFLREVAFLKEQQHPAIMRVFDEGTFHYRVDGQQRAFPFVIAEYLPKTLQDVIRSSTASVAQRVSIALELLSALTWLEGGKPQAVHRDIKPQNIFLKGNSCVLGDFGLMKLLGATDDDDRLFFKESVGAGMPYFYRTPDLVAYARGQGPLTVKSDVFQLGLVLAQLFTGRNPAKRPVGDDMFTPVELEPLGACPGEFSGSIATLVSRMLILDSERREHASQLLDPWSGLFREVCASANRLEGRVF